MHDCNQLHHWQTSTEQQFFILKVLSNLHFVCCKSSHIGNFNFIMMADISHHLTYFFNPSQTVSKQFPQTFFKNFPKSPPSTSDPSVRLGEDTVNIQRPSLCHRQAADVMVSGSWLAMSVAHLESAWWPMTGDLNPAKHTTPSCTTNPLTLPCLFLVFLLFKDCFPHPHLL